MKKNDLPKIIAWLAQIMHCPVCDQHYAFEQTHILFNQRTEDDGQSLVVHSDCKNCRSSATFTISLFGSEIFSVGMISDLHGSDALKFRSRPPLTCDEIMQLHAFLQTFDGDFEAIFKS